MILYARSCAIKTVKELKTKFDLTTIELIRSGAVAQALASYDISRKNEILESLRS